MAFIDHIEPYLYASFLNTLKQGFLEDLRNLPANLGPLLRSERIKKFINGNPKYQQAWITLPVLVFLSGIQKGKPISDCIKDLYPDEELKNVAPDYYNVLKITAILSESIRDKSGEKDWIIFSKFKTDILDDPIAYKLFFGLLYESTKAPINTAGTLNQFIKPENADKIKMIIQSFGDQYTATKDAYTAMKTASLSGQSADIQSILKLISLSVTDVKFSIDAVNGLTDNVIKYSVKTEIFFEMVPRVTALITNITEKKYSSAVMNSLIIIDEYAGKNKADISPFTAYTSSPLTAENLSIYINQTLIKLQTYNSNYADEKVTGFITELKTIRAEITTAASPANLTKTQAAFAKITAYKYNFDSSEMLKKTLKYASFMASVSEAKNPEEVSAAIEAAILPVGSSSIKYYTAFSFSLNSYIGGAVYRELYNSAATGKTKFSTAGVALPIGLAASMSTRNNYIGSLSLFISVIDIGAIASYRISSSKEISGNPLPDFTWQNIIAPGGFLVLGRLFKTPLAIGFGIQKGPQLKNISASTADLSPTSNWRFGGFLSVDIPLFNLYSKSLRRPIGD